MANKPTYEELEQRIQELEKSSLEEEIENIFWLSPDLIGYGNLEGYFTKVNPSFTKKLGYSENEFHEKQFLSFLHEDDVKKTKKALLKAQKGIIHIYIENRYMCKDGSYKWIDWHVQSSIHKNTFLAIGREITELKQSEEALQQSEERFRHAFENANIGMCLVSTDGRFIQVNDRLCRIIGYSREQLEGMNVNDVTYSEDRELGPDFFRDSMSGKTDNIVYEKRYVHSGGHLIWSQISSSIVRDLKGKPLYFISHVQDITQQKSSEEALKASEEKFSMLFQANPAYISLTTVEDGRFLAVNDAFTSITGYEQSEVIGRTSEEIGLWSDPGDREQLIKQIEQYGHSRLQKVELIRKDGYFISGLWSVEKVELEGKTHLIAMLIDATEKMKAERALLESEERYRILVETAGQAGWGIILIQDMDQLKAACVFSNAAASSLTGYSGEELAITSWLDIVHPLHRDAAKKRYGERLQGKSHKDVYEISVLNKRGDEIFIELASVAINYREKKAAVVFFRDIRQRRQTENELAEKTRNLEETNVALNILLKKRERDKRDVEERVVSNVRMTVEPYLKKLKKRDLDNREIMSMDLIESGLNEIVSSFSVKLSSKHLGLTPGELQVAYLVKEGKRTKNIAVLLNLSTKTIEGYRKNLRKKLGLRNTKMNLRTHLLSIQ